MLNDNNLLFGVLALQAGVIDRQQFAEACIQWSTRRTGSLADVLVEAGDMTHDERVKVERLQQNVLSVAKVGIDGDASMAGESDLTTTLGFPSTLPLSSAEPWPSRCDTNSSVGEADCRSRRFAVLGLHAVGGVGQVWLAKDADLQRNVALKVLRPEWMSDAKVRARFLQEARITGQLEHPGIVPVYELGHKLENNQPFYAMRFVHGRTLSEAAHAYHAKRDVEQAEPIDLLQLLNAFVAVCNTVEYAHSRGVIHRDLKGPNVILGDFGEVIVVDWGMAKWIEQADPEPTGNDEPSPYSESNGWFDTEPGQTLGTPAYMAPEQAAGSVDSFDSRTDVYGLGTILYEILTGRPPFTGTSLAEVLRKVREEEPVRPRTISAAIPPVLEAICLRALAKDPTHRQSSARELAEVTQTWLAEFAQAPLKNMAASEQMAHEALRKVHDQQRALIELIRSEVFQSPDLQATLRRVTEVAAHTMDVERVSIWRFTADRAAIRCVDLYELGTKTHSSGADLEAESFPQYFRALDTNEVIAADDAASDPRTLEFAESYLRVLNIGSMLDAPIHLGGRLEGVLCHEHVGRPRQWTAEEQLFAIALSHLVSLAIEQRKPDRAGAELADECWC